MARTVVLLLSALAFLSTSFAFNLELDPYSRECFHEDLSKGDTLTFTFETSNEAMNSAEIDFTATGPEGILINELNKEIGVHTIDAKNNGKYEYCFGNERSSETDKEVSFNTHVTRKADEPSGATSELEKEIRTLSQAVSQIRDEQEYIVIREKTHRNTAESTNSRVMYWSIFETIVLVAVCLWQVWYLRRFFEVKRVV